MACICWRTFFSDDQLSDQLAHFNTTYKHTRPLVLSRSVLDLGKFAHRHCEPILFFKMRSWNTFRSLLKSICQSHTSTFKTTPNTKKSTNLDTLMNWHLKLTYELAREAWKLQFYLQQAKLTGRWQGMRRLCLKGKTYCFTKYCIFKVIKLIKLMHIRLYRLCGGSLSR